MNTAIFDLTDPAVAKALEGCEVGHSKPITITITPKSKDATQMVADITELEADYSEEEAPEVEAEEVAPPIVTDEKKSTPAFALK